MLVGSIYINLSVVTGARNLYLSESKTQLPKTLDPIMKMQTTHFLKRCF